MSTLYNYSIDFTYFNLSGGQYQKPKETFLGVREVDSIPRQ